MKEILIGLLFTSISSCSFAQNLISFKDESFHFNDTDRVLVFYTVNDLNMRMQTENYFLVFTDKFKLFDPVPSINLFSPLNNLSENEIDSTLKANQINFILTIEITDSYTQTDYLPGTTNSSYYYTINGNNVYGTSHSYNSGGASIEKPRLNFKVKIFDINASKNIWIAEVKTAGNAFSNNLSLSKSLVAKVINKLEKDFTAEINDNDNDKTLNIKYSIIGKYICKDQNSLKLEITKMPGGPLVTLSTGDTTLINNVKEDTDYDKLIPGVKVNCQNGSAIEFRVGGLILIKSSGEVINFGKIVKIY